MNSEPGGSKQIVVGLGKGRCGTVSLAHLLSAQPSSIVTHEWREHEIP